MYVEAAARLPAEAAIGERERRAALAPPQPAPNAQHYGGFWWINDGDEKRFSSLPNDTYYASGAFGQAALVIPSYDLVIARMGWNVPDDNDALNLFAGLVVRAVERGSD